MKLIFLFQAVNSDCKHLSDVGGFVSLTAPCDVPRVSGGINEQLRERFPFYLDTFF